MNTNALSRHYDRLTPQERLALLVAASARGDELEHARLARTAARAPFAMPDYYGLGEGLQLLSLLYVTEQMELAALYWHCSGRLDRLALGRGHDRQARVDRLLGTVRMLAYRFTVNADAWRRLGRELRIDTGRLLERLPGRETLRVTEQATRGDALSPEEATTWLSGEGRSDGRPATVEEALADMHALLQDRVDWWS
jgi:hypothetical protein